MPIAQPIIFEELVGSNISWWIFLIKCRKERGEEGIGEEESRGKEGKEMGEEYWSGMGRKDRWRKRRWEDRKGEEDKGGEEQKIRV